MVLSNLDGTEMPEALMYYLYDLYHARPTTDYAGAFLAEAKARPRPERERRQDWQPPAAVAPSVDPVNVT